MKGKEINSFFELELEPEQFLARLDSLQNNLATFHQHYLDTITMPENTRKLMKKRNKIQLINLKLYYMLIRQDGMLDTGKEVKIPEQLRNVANEIPFDSTLLKRAN